jgi:hypothetical protein
MPITVLFRHLNKQFLDRCGGGGRPEPFSAAIVLLNVSGVTIVATSAKASVRVLWL